MLLLRRAIVYFALFLLFPTLSSAATADDFKSREYQNSTGLDFIRAAEAYALGYTGAGVVLGIMDSAVLVDHPELAGKTDQIFSIVQETGLPYVPDYSKDTHGSHVAGIMAAIRDGRDIPDNMHGVAFDAGLATIQVLDDKNESDKPLTYPDMVSFFASRPNLRIINNSLGGDYYPSLLPNQDKVAAVMKYMEGYPLLSALAKLATDHDKVVVFAAGNSGRKSPGVEGMLPRYAGSDMAAWLSVGSLDIGEKAMHMGADGKIIVEPGGVSVFSNLAVGAELWTVMAPGSAINSLYSADKGYISYSGTSMSAPYVSGALGLVQQAFPWMTGKQLADSVLTTANTGFTAPDYVVQLEEIKKDDGSEEYKAWIRYIDKAPPSLTADKAKELIRAALEDTASEDRLDMLLYLVDDGKWDKEEISFDQAFGQGLLDVGKAVRGIARLDANRMSKDDVQELSELNGQKNALETFDTKGYVAEFSNDIVQRRWDDKYHHPDFKTTSDFEMAEDAKALIGLDVGLRKVGDGLLILSGTNKYEGATVIEGGGLSVSKRADGTGGILLNSDVLVRQNGLLQGNGEIQKSVVNYGVVAPGNSIGTLTVGGYTQTPGGVLRIEFNAAGQHDVLHITNSATLGGTLALTPQPDFYREPVRVDPLSLGGSITPTGTFSSTLAALASPTLGMSLSSGPNGYTLLPNRAPEAYSRYAHNAGARTVGQALGQVAHTAQGDMQPLLAALDFSAQDGRDVRRALSQLGPEAYDVASRASLLQQREFNMLLLRRMLGNEAARRLNAGRQQDAAAPAQQADAASAAGGGWAAWVTPFGSSALQGNSGDTAGWASNGVGILGGMERRWDAGLTLGMHVALSGRRTDVNGYHEAQVKTHGAHVGAQALLAPDVWEGFYLTAQARLGLEDNEMRREVAFNGYERHNQSRWTGLTGSALLGGGKDWTWGQCSVGPVGWLEYSFVQRPDLSETGGQASRLHVDGGMFDSLSLALGGHVGHAWEMSDKASLAVDLLAAWRHELLDGSFHSAASFRGYNAAGFESATDLVGRDALLLQGSLRLTHASNFFAQVDLGGEFFRTDSTAMNVGLSFGLEF